VYFSCILTGVCNKGRLTLFLITFPTRYGLDAPGIETGGREIFRTRPDRRWGKPSLLHNEWRVFPGDFTGIYRLWCGVYHPHNL